MNKAELPILTWWNFIDWSRLTAQWGSGEGIAGPPTLLENSSKWYPKKTAANSSL
jgi:hypothetical protein